MAFSLGRLFQNSARMLTDFGNPISRHIHHITGFNPSPVMRNTLPLVQNSSALSPVAASMEMTAGGAWSLISTRFWRRVEVFKEQKRLKKFGWKARMSTEKGRIIIMKRLLRGRLYLTH